MNMKKKIATLGLVAAMLLTSAGATLAYFTDTDSQKNVMTMGKIEISQDEQQRDANGGLVDFEQDKPLMPMVDTRTDKQASPVVNGYFDPAMKNVVDKVITVTNEAEEPADKNNRNYDAYVRTIIAFETATEYVENTDTVRRGGKEIFNTYLGTLTTKGFKWLERDTVVVNGTEYVLGVMVYENALKPQEVSVPSLKQIFLSPDANNEVAILFGDEYDILALSQGVQTAGFESAEEALNEAFGDLETVEETKLIEWLSAV